MANSQREMFETHQTHVKHLVIHWVDIIYTETLLESRYLTSYGQHRTFSEKKKLIHFLLKKTRNKLESF